MSFWSVEYVNILGYVVGRLDEISIGVWKYLRRGINAYLKNQVENYSKIDHSVNNQKSKISKYNFSKAQKEMKDNILEIMIQTSLFLLSNIITVT